jgi:HD-like signal output (HDOD) protein
MKQHLLFVDDDRSVLQGLQRMLRPLRHEWDMAFANNGPEALDYMARTHVDVIISDMRMPDMDGAQLLTEVMRKYPATARLILSGQASRETVMRALVPTHQYLAKPCDPDTLKAAITRATTLHALLTDTNLRALVAGMSTLPSLPSLYLEVTELLNDAKTSMQMMSEVISRDIGMTAKILQVANSAFFGQRQTTKNLTRAITMLGLDNIKALVLSLAVFSQCPQAQLKRFSLQMLWDHCFATATSAKHIAQMEQQEACMNEATFTAGLLHECGRLIFAVNVPDAYEQALALVKQEGLSVWEAEREIFEVSHAEVGAYLLGLWGLPDPIIEAVAFHHRPLQGGAQTFSPLTAVHVANALLSEQTDAGPPQPAVDFEYLTKLGLTDRLPLWQTQGAAFMQGGNSQ